MRVWQKAMDLVEEVYLITSHFPTTEKFALASQLQRAATSVPLNISEGFGRETSADKANKYVIARGECTEAHTILLTSARLKFVSTEKIQKAVTLCDEIGKMLSGLIKKYSKH